MVDYPYGSRSLLDHPEGYAYARFEGAAYLEAWRESRGRAIDCLPADIPIPRCTPAQQDSQQDIVMTRDWLRLWLQRDPTTTDFATSGLAWLIRRFEASKKLRESYRLPDWQRESGYSRELGLYALFGILLGRFGRGLEGPVRWIPLNTLLKVNDILVSEINALGNAAGWARHSLEAEQEILA